MNRHRLNSDPLTMQIKRSNFEFLVLAAILGSIMAATLHFGYGAGVLTLLFWGVVIFLVLRAQQKKRARAAAEGQTQEPLKK